MAEKNEKSAEANMLCSSKLPSIRPLIFCIFLIDFVYYSVAHNLELSEMKRRALMGFTETPSGGNETFHCSPSGPCIPCSRSEKSDEKYHCGETGYRIRLKCVLSGSRSNTETNLETPKKRKSLLEITNMGISQRDTKLRASTSQRRLQDNPSKSEGGPKAYVNYRSCIPAVNEEKLSLLGFEALMLALLLSSGSFIYFKQKRSSLAAGGVPVRLPTNARF